MSSFKDLIVWQKGIELTKEVYALCKVLPASEQMGLSSQMRRAAISIPSNIAEGYRRNGRKEYRQFCALSLGSAAELETQLIITHEVYSQSDVTHAMDLCTEIQKMLTALIAKL